jgi:hypothetical protein
MEQLYAEPIPIVISAGDYKDLYIVATVVLYVLPFYAVPKGKIAIYFIWLLFASAAATLFFTNYSEFCNLLIHNYVLAGTNISTVINLQTEVCPANVCWTQTIQSVLIYNNMQYTTATYTNIYYSTPPAPEMPTTQYFLPWEPMTPYTIDFSGVVPLIYLISAILIYIIIIILTIILNRKQPPADADDDELLVPEDQRDELRSML